MRKRGLRTWFFILVLAVAIVAVLGSSGTAGATQVCRDVGADELCVYGQDSTYGTGFAVWASNNNNSGLLVYCYSGTQTYWIVYGVKGNTGVLATDAAC